MKQLEVAVCDCGRRIAREWHAAEWRWVHIDTGRQACDGTDIASPRD